LILLPVPMALRTRWSHECANRQVAACALWLLGVGCGGRILLSSGDGIGPDAQAGWDSESRATTNAAAGSDDAQAEPMSTGTPAPHDGSIGAGSGTRDGEVAASPEAADEFDGPAGDGATTDAFWCGDVQAVPDCVAYQDLLMKCFMRDVAFACQSSILPVGDADVQAIQQLCADNLQRLQAACR
jgi:hypothetical protein